MGPEVFEERPLGAGPAAGCNRTHGIGRGENQMRRIGSLLVGTCALLLTAGSAFSETDPVATVVQGCEKELSTYCKDVTPGKGRGLACLYAHEDKLSTRCEYALYDAAAQLQRVIAALSFLANECRDDLEKFCAAVPPGEGRLLDCIDKNQDKLSDRCKQGLKDVAAK
jgi:hypothetical protein